MNHVFSNIIDRRVLVYLDNILVYSEATDGHEKHLYKVILQLCAYKLQEKYAKCEFRASLGPLSWSHSWVW